MRFSDINIRDPFILLENGVYYLYGSRGHELWGLCTGVDGYRSTDCVEWEGPFEVFHRPDDFWSDRNFWAPEVHKYQDRFYMFMSFKSAGRCRATQILTADTPLGPFRVYSEPITPADWECLDGTFFVEEDGTPYMVFCHEWVQAGDGQMCAVELSRDLTHAVGEPMVLFCASEPEWAYSPDWVPEERGHGNVYVTDGPFLYRTAGGRLLMLWSSFTKDGYCEAVSYSESGKITGPWRHEKELLFSKDGGHGMLYRNKENELYFICHSPNEKRKEHPVIYSVAEQDGRLAVK